MSAQRGNSYKMQRSAPRVTTRCSMARRAKQSEAEILRSYQTIRFQISLLLLLSTLNSVLMIAIGAAVASALSDGPSMEFKADLQLMSARVDALHQSVLFEPEPSTSLSEDELKLLQSLQLSSQQLETDGNKIQTALSSYQASIENWRAEGSLQDSEAHKRMEQAHLHLLGSLIYAQERPHWLDAALAYLPLFIGWIVLVALLTVLMSIQLRRIISLPLQRMTEAAARVQREDLKQPIPTDGAAAELAALARALEQSRQGLARSIEQLDEQNQVMKSMIGALESGVLFLDNQGRVIDYTSKTQELLGKLPGDLIEGVPLSNALPGLDEAALDHNEIREQSLSFDLTGSKQHLEIRVSPVHGEERAFVAVLNDVTELVELEELKREFLSVVTHELKTPLTAIEGYIRLLLMGKGGELTDKQRRFLNVTREQVDVLKAMIQDLLDATRLEGGNLRIEPAPTRIDALVDEVGQSMKASAGEIDFSWDRGPEVQIFIDPFRGRQILTNYLSNAFKFTEPTGSVYMWCEQVEDQIWVHVQDTGRGVPESAMPALFDRFFQVERGDKRISGGAGLGLYICKQLATQMGGEVAVESTLGEGSRFSVTFPILKEQ